jgi:RNA polymerase sigma factor (sigma-70 family)
MEKGFQYKVEQEFKSIKDKLYWYAFRQLKLHNISIDQSDDVVQDMMIKFFNRFEDDVESLKKILMEGTLEGYFKTSIKNIIIDLTRKQIRQKTDTTDDLSAETDDRPQADKILEEKQEEKKFSNLTDVLQKELSEDDFNIVSLYYLKNKKFREIGDILDINPNTIRTKMTSIRLRMYDICQKHKIKL